MGRKASAVISPASVAPLRAIKLRAAIKETGTAMIVPMVEAMSAIKIVSIMRPIVTWLASLRPVTSCPKISSTSIRCGSSETRTSGMVKSTTKRPSSPARNEPTCRATAVSPGGCQRIMPRALGGKPSPISRSTSCVVVVQFGASVRVRPWPLIWPPLGSSGQGERKLRLSFCVSVS
jgi:hypothetical protein